MKERYDKFSRIGMEPFAPAFPLNLRFAESPGAIDAGRRHGACERLKIMDIADVNELMDAFGNAIAVPGLQLDFEHTAGLRLCDNTQILFEYCRDTAKLFIYSVLTAWPDSPEERLEISELLLALNYRAEQKVVCTIHLPTARVFLQTALDRDVMTINALLRGVEAILSERKRCLSAMMPAMQASPKAISQNRKKQLSTSAILLGVAAGDR